MGFAVMTGFGAVFNTAEVRPGDRVAVIGCGGVGLNVVQAAAIAGATSILAVDVFEPALELARALGATETVRGPARPPPRRSGRSTARSRRWAGARRSSWRWS